jgi:hypothetical protein
MNKDLKVLFRRCETLGCTVVHRRNNHFTIILPWGPRVFIAGTPSDKRAIRNIVGELRRNGLAV